jgi:hypothetical protein
MTGTMRSGTCPHRSAPSPPSPPLLVLDQQAGRNGEETGKTKNLTMKGLSAASPVPAARDRPLASRERALAPVSRDAGREGCSSNP